MRLSHAAPLVLFALAACGSASEEYRVAGLVPDDVTFETVPVCHGTGCAKRTEVRLDETDWSKVDAVFLAPAAGAADERGRIGIAIGIMEVLVGPQSGTRTDTGRNQHSGNQPDQLDCVDEAVNSTTYLRLIAERGLLRFHDVAPPANRIIEVFNAHNTAVVVDRATGISYAVDSWFYDNGSPAVVLPLAMWRAGWDPLYGDTVPPEPVAATPATNTAVQPAATATAGGS